MSPFQGPNYISGDHADCERALEEVAGSLASGGAVTLIAIDPVRDIGMLAWTDDDERPAVAARPIADWARCYRAFIRAVEAQPCLAVVGEPTERERAWRRRYYDAWVALRYGASTDGAPPPSAFEF